VGGHPSHGPRLGCAFYRSQTGHEPVRDWLRGLGKEVSKTIGSDILSVQWSWPVGKPLIDGLGGGLYEISRHREEGAHSAQGGRETRSQASERGDGTMSRKHIGSSLSSFLNEMEIREETELLAIKKTLALQLSQAMKRRSFSQSRLAKEMRTSRTVINRMLDPSDTGVTLATLTRASQVLGLRIDIRLSATRKSAA